MVFHCLIHLAWQNTKKSAIMLHIYNNINLYVKSIEKNKQTGKNVICCRFLLKYCTLPKSKKPNAKVRLFLSWCTTLSLNWTTVFSLGFLFAKTEIFGFVQIEWAYTFWLFHVHFKLHSLNAVNADKPLIKGKALTFVRTVLKRAIKVYFNSIVIKHDFFYEHIYYHRCFKS